MHRSQRPHSRAKGWDGRVRPAVKWSGLRPSARTRKCLTIYRIAEVELHRLPDPIIPIKDGFSYSNRYPFQRSRPPRRRPRYPSLGTLRQCKLCIVRFRASAKAHSLRCISSSGKIIRFCLNPIMAYFPRAISSLGAGIQLSAQFAIFERAKPASNRPSWAECPQLPLHQFASAGLIVCCPAAVSFPSGRWSGRTG